MKTKKPQQTGTITITQVQGSPFRTVVGKKKDIETYIKSNSPPQQTGTWEKQVRGSMSTAWLNSGDIKALNESTEDLLSFLRSELLLQRQKLLKQMTKARKELKQNIGMLRQWLNEDRITDSKKMVTNEQIEMWFDDLLQALHEMEGKEWGGGE